MFVKIGPHPEVLLHKTPPTGHHFVLLLAENFQNKCFQIIKLVVNAMKGLGSKLRYQRLFLLSVCLVFDRFD